MNEFNNLILITSEEDDDEEDKTADIEDIKPISDSSYSIKFSNSDDYYQYRNNRVNFLTEPEDLDPLLYTFVSKGKIQKNLTKILKFKIGTGNNTQYIVVTFSENKKKNHYDYNDIDIARTSLFDGKINDIFEYLKRTAEITSLELKKSDSSETEKILLTRFNELRDLKGKCIAAVYLYPDKYKIKKYDSDFLIFPFGINHSQLSAVKNAVSNSLSVIQGPPGTGKTQTLLNIIANLVIQNKTVQVVSNNNSAVENILLKLTEKHLDFICALLGNKKNRTNFINKQTGYPEEIEHWQKNFQSLQNIKFDIKNYLEKLNTIFLLQEEKAAIIKERTELQLEKNYFISFAESHSPPVSPDINVNKHLSSRDLLKLWAKLQKSADNDKRTSILVNLRFRFIKKIAYWKFYKNSAQTIIVLLQLNYYLRRDTELESNLISITNRLLKLNEEKILQNLQNASMNYFKACLSKRFATNSPRKLFTLNEMDNNPSFFQNEYPVTLSSTYSATVAISSKAQFDYVLMDEASQCDIATGTLALSNAENAVIVGDKNQLKNVVDNNKKTLLEEVIKKTTISRKYDVSCKSFLQSVCDVFPDVPQILLKEHYRCHPKIINFCNKKFYDNQLVIMTKDNNEKNVLNIIYSNKLKTNKRENKRQAECIKEDILSKNKLTDVGIIAPYKKQVECIRKEVALSEIKIDTIHKFQGQEKKAIILSTTDSVVNDFSDERSLINVAVSRAKDQFFLVVSKQSQPPNSNIGDLISYIKYSNGTVIESKVRSVFDFLYSHYQQETSKYRSRISSYDSENAIYDLIKKILNELQIHDLGIVCHYPLSSLIDNFSDLSNDDEIQYARNSSTHLDFLMLNSVTKQPFLAVEVDGSSHNYRIQAERDKLKNHILDELQIPLIRLDTQTGNEEQKLLEKISEIKSTGGK